MSVVGFLRSILGQSEVRSSKPHYEEEKQYLDIGHIKGHDNVKAGLQIAAAGRHNVLLVGPPGEGKSTIVSTVPGFAPCSGIVEVGPNITESGLLGGGRVLVQGAITDADNGILFMDELPQYDRALLESLRGPMESGRITVARGGETRVFPCNFQLLSAMNPCPCGYFGTDKCTCTSAQVTRYIGKLSGPIVDRIDMFMYMDRLSAEDRFTPSKVGQSAAFKQRVLNAIHFRKVDRGQNYFNKEIHSKDIYNSSSTVLNWSSGAIALFKKYLGQKYFSTRKGVRLARLSRTMADILQSHTIEAKHIYMVEEYLDPPGSLL